MTAPVSPDRKSTSRFSFRRSKSSKRQSHKVRRWFSSSSKLESCNDLAADAAAAMREVNAENQINGPYTPRVEYGSPRPDITERDAAWSSQEQVEEHYNAMGWSVVEISKDGNCLFRAISDQLYTNELFHRDIRQRLVDFIQREHELFKPFVEDEEVSEYCTRMREDGEWGGHLELYAAAKLFNIHIVVHTGPVRRLRVENDDTAKRNPPPPPPYRILHLLYKDDHYSSLYPKEHDVYATPDKVVDNAVQSTTKAVVSPQKSVTFQESAKEDKCVRFQVHEEDIRVPEDTKALTCEQQEVPECGVFLPHQAIFYHGKRRPSGATLFSMVHMPSVKNLLEVPESPSTTASESSTSSETSSEASRARPTAPTIRAVPMSYPSKTTFHKGRPVTTCM